MKKLLPFVFLFAGLGAGVGAGILLRPEAPLDAADAGQAAQEQTADEPAARAHQGNDSSSQSNEYVKLNNQFVVPIVSGDKVTALVVLALSIEVPAGVTDTVYQRV